MNKCPYCGKVRPNSQKKCDCQLTHDSSKISFEKSSKSKNIIFIFIGTIVLFALLIFIFSFHIITSSEGKIRLIPKAHLSLADTFVKVDDIIKQYNERTFSENVRGTGVNQYLVDKLKERGLIEFTNKDSKYDIKQDITFEMYNKIIFGMKYNDVIIILGKMGKELSRSDIAGYVTVMESWENKDGSNINIMFQNGKVIQKAQYGLK